MRRGRAEDDPAVLMLAAHDPVDHVLPHRFFELFGSNLNFGAKTIPLLNIHFGPMKFYFTNHLLMTLVSAGLCLLILPWIARSYARRGVEPSAPRGLTNLFEAVLQFIRLQVVQPILGPRTDAFMPFLWTLFFFILFCNLLGMVPLDSIVYLVSGRRLQHIGGTATGNLAVTGGLAICSFFAIHLSGVAAAYRGLVDGTYGHHDHGEGHDTGGAGHGHGEHPSGHHHHGRRGKPPVVAAVLAAPLYLWNFAPHVFRPEPGAGLLARAALFPLDLVMWLFLLLLEFLGAVIKPFALMIRLFANMIAGHIVLASILMLIFTIGTYTAGVTSAVGCVALSCLELFVAFLQAYIFVFLTTLFIGAAVAPEH